MKKLRKHLKEYFLTEIRKRQKKKNTNRNYRKEYDNYHSQPEQIENRGSRNAARTEKEKKVGKAALKGKDIDHKNHNPKDNSSGNLRVREVSANRSDNKPKK